MPFIMKTVCARAGRQNCPCESVPFPLGFHAEVGILLHRTWMTIPPCSGKLCTAEWWHRTQSREASSRLCTPKIGTLLWVEMTALRSPLHEMDVTLILLLTLMEASLLSVIVELSFISATFDVYIKWLTCYCHAHFTSYEQNYCL